MGQKVNPVGFRVNVNNNWTSVWYDDANYRENLIKDLTIQDYVLKNFKNSDDVNQIHNNFLKK